jgi:alanine or glycine:cation symporter, AGCS family
METLQGLFESLNGMVWGVPMIVLILGTGFFLHLRLGFMPVFKIPYGFRMVWASRKPGAAAEGEITPYAALMTALSATIGTGNIAGAGIAQAAGSTSNRVFSGLGGMMGTPSSTRSSSVR